MLSVGQEFRQEAAQGLEQIEQSILDNSLPKQELLDLIFRVIHTIKGNALMVGFKDLATAAHELEQRIGDLKSRAALTQADLNAILQESDKLALMLDQSDEAAQSLSQQGAFGILGAGALAGADPSAGAGSNAWANSGARSITGAPACKDTLHVSMRAQKSLSGFDLVGFLQDLDANFKLGEFFTDTTDLAPLESFQDPLLLGFEFNIQAAQVQDAKDYLARFGEFFSVDVFACGISKAAAGELYKTRPHLLKTLAAQGVFTSEQPAEPQEFKKFARIEVEKIDKIISLMQEMAILNASVQNSLSASAPSELKEKIFKLSMHFKELHELSLQTRMIPIGEIFERFKRSVYELSSALGKSVFLELAGTKTQIDKTIAGHLKDPLMHLIRNSLDHAIEPPQVRERLGKNKTARLLLSAEYENGYVHIRVEDDGAGIDLERIRQASAARGLILPGATLSQSELLNLMFLPGLSTARTVSNISGRGVGLDVVKKNIDDLRGSISIQTKKGAGTRFDIFLPPSLAITQGFFFRQGGVLFAIGLESISECVALEDLGSFAADPSRWSLGGLGAAGRQDLSRQGTGLSSAEDLSGADGLISSVWIPRTGGAAASGGGAGADVGAGGKILGGAKIQAGVAISDEILAGVQICSGADLSAGAASGASGANATLGNELKVIDLESFFGLKSQAARRNAVVVRHKENVFAIATDELLGEAQMVIKPLGKYFNERGVIDSVAMLGGTEIALILDLPKLIAQNK
ncbi:MAG: chemotaxis protein CheA [Helicobacteraceae bacterium]